MQEVELPSPKLPAPDFERAIDELKCDVGIRQACSGLDARIAYMLKCKTELVAEEARQAAADNETERQKEKRLQQIKNDQYEFQISKNCVNSDTMRQDMMILQLKLSAAEDDLTRRRAAADIISKQMNIEATYLKALKSQNAALRGRVVGLEGKLKDSWQQLKDLHAYTTTILADKESEIEYLQKQLRNDGDQTKSELAAAQAIATRLQDELALAERTAAAAQERANLAEQTLRHKEMLANERAQMQADMHHYSQDLAKMALQTGNVANTKALEAAQSALVDERRARSSAERQVTQLKKQVASLESQLERKNKRISRLEESLQQREVATPAGPRAVKSALDAVGGILNQLDNSPDSALPAMKRNEASLKSAKNAAFQFLSPIGEVPGGKENEVDGSEDKDDPRHNANDDDDYRDDDFTEQQGARRKKTNPKAQKPPRPPTTLASGLVSALDANITKRKRNDASDGKIAGGEAKQSRRDEAMASPRTDSLDRIWRDTNDMTENTRPQGTTVMFPPPSRQPAQSPLAALNPSTVAAASNQMRVHPDPLVPTAKPPMVGGARSLLGISKMGGGKRRLLGVSALNAQQNGQGGEGLPAQKILTSGFQIPKFAAPKRP